jgi:hypothetical protein
MYYPRAISLRLEPILRVSKVRQGKESYARAKAVEISSWTHVEKGHGIASAGSHVTFKQSASLLSPFTKYCVPYELPQITCHDIIAISAERINAEYSGGGHHAEQQLEYHIFHEPSQDLQARVTPHFRRYP